MSARPHNIEAWLATATRGLEPSIRERLKVELASHFYDAYDDLVREGRSEADAAKEALASLGDVEEARQNYREQYALAAPWLAGDFPPSKPQDEDYGFLKGNKLVGCSRGELIEVCRKGETVSLAWTPETQKLVPIETIPFLFEAIKEGRIKSARESLWMGIANVVSVVLNSRDLLGGPFRHDVLWIGFLLAGPLLCVWAWFKARETTPEILAEDLRNWEAKQWLSLGKTPLVSGALIAMSVTAVVGVICYAMTSQYAEVVGLSEFSLPRGEWWRIFSAVASPAPMGFLVVVLGLLLFGRVIELVIGSTLLPLIFVSSALVGSFFTMTVGSSVLGASAGVFGVLGFLAVVRTREPLLVEQKFSTARVILVASIAGIIGFDIIYNAAHLGGLLCGLVWGWSLKVPEKFARSRGAVAASWVAIGIYLTGSVSSITLLINRMMKS